MLLTGGNIQVLRPSSIDSRQPMYVLYQRHHIQVTSDLMKAPPNTRSGNKARLWQARGRRISRRFSSGKPGSYTLRSIFQPNLPPCLTEKKPKAFAYYCLPISSSICLDSFTDSPLSTSNYPSSCCTYVYSPCTA